MSNLSTETKTGLNSMQIDHLMISVPNYQDTLQWYQSKLNATIEKEWTVDELPDLQLAYLNVSGFRIEVVGTTQARLGMPNFNNFGEALRTTGIGHFCFRVDSVDDAIAELNKRGVPTFVEAADYPNIGVRVGFVKDNNGNVIEFSGSMNSAKQ
ncbi:VOC family protein [Pleurocapsa sp. FMAR1]|uniref:VOC family protein n=1 Tax=Pleurocapsa sp. FMAR1 TaxID=3040204 RepID=UPI0029C7C283|nr:VOC family protein [Pleurocapsa sp. FMAR1]